MGQVVGPPPPPRAYMGFAECGGRLYVFGGYSDALGTLCICRGSAAPPPSTACLRTSIAYSLNKGPASLSL